MLKLAWSCSGGVVWVVGVTCGVGERAIQSARVSRTRVCVFFRFVSFCFPLWVFSFFFFVSPVFLACLSARPFRWFDQWAIGRASRRGRSSGARPARHPESGGGGSAAGRGHGRSARRRAVQFNVRHRLRSCAK